MITLEQKIKDLIGEDVKVEAVSVIKNNGIKLEGVSVMPTDSDLAPTIYREDNESDSEFIDRVVSVYRRSDCYNIKDEFDQIVSDAENVYARVIPVLINTEKNTELLETAIHDNFCDLSIIYKVVLNKDSTSGMATVTIRDNIVKAYNLDIDMIKKRAFENLDDTIKMTSLHDYLVGQVAEFIGKDLSEICDDDLPSFLREAGERMVYMMSTNNLMFGAASMLSNTAMTKICNIFDTDSVYVIPSSIHEILLVPQEDSNIDYLINMIRTVNATNVCTEYFLSDNLYLYHRDASGSKWTCIDSDTIVVVDR